MDVGNITVVVASGGLDRAAEKMSKLISLLEQAKQLTREISETDLLKTQFTRN